MTNDTTTSATPPVEQSFSFPHPENYIDGPYKLKRNEYGLLQNLDYKFDSEGYIDWRSMIDPKFLYPNRGWFERSGKDVPASIEGLEDYQLVCKLGGWEKLARIRGYSSVDYKLEHLSNGVSAECTIKWIPNYETRQKLLPHGQWTEGNEPYFDNTAIEFKSTASSTTENCGEFMSPFKETHAENRSFSRCVRKFLNINIVSDDEIPKGKNAVHEESQESGPIVLDPNRNLEHIAKKKYKNWVEFRKFLVEQNYKKSEDKVWNGYADIPVKDCRQLIDLLTK